MIGTTSLANFFYESADHLIAKYLNIILSVLMDRKFYFLLLIQVASSVVQGDENQTSVISVQLTHKYQCPPSFFYNTKVEV